MRQDRSTQVGLSEYMGSIRRRWYLLVLGLALGAGAGLGYVQLAAPVYTANIQLFVSTSGATDLNSVVQGGQFSQERTASYAQLVTGRDLAARVIEDLGVDMSLEEFSSAVSAQVLPETVILDVDVNAPSPERAVAIAESIGNEFRELVQALERTASSSAPVQVSVVAAPVLPTGPSSPQPAVALLAGVVFGALLGGLGAVVRDRLDTSIRDDETAAEVAGVPVLGLVPHHPAEDRTVDMTPGSRWTEAFQVLRTNLRFASVDGDPRVIMVTSSEQGEGKTTTAIGLAQVLSHAGRRVLLVEADVRRPRATRYLGLVRGAGLTDVLAGTASLEDVLQPVGDGRLTVLGSGPLPPNPSELLSSDAMAALLAELRSAYDIVLLDAPPLLAVADAGGLTTLSDGALLCIRWGATSRADVQRSRALLQRAGGRTLGALMTFVPPQRVAGYTYEYSDGADESSPGRFRRVLRRGWKGAGAASAPQRPVRGSVAAGPVNPTQTRVSPGKPPVHPSRVVVGAAKAPAQSAQHIVAVRLAAGLTESRSPEGLS